MKSLRIAGPLGARIVVFHPAREREPEVLERRLAELSEARKKEKIKALIGLEVTGDGPELGSVDDYIDILRAVPGTDIVGRLGPRPCPYWRRAPHESGL